MSYVQFIPETLTFAADNLHSVGAAVDAANTLVAAPTSGVTPAAADDVSALTATQFAAHAQMYHAESNASSAG